GARMPDQGDGPEAEKDRPSDRVRVHALPEAAQRRPQEQATGRRDRPGTRGTADRVGHGPRRALQGLEGHVAGEAVGDHNVRLTCEEVAALHIADEANPLGSRELLVRLDYL